MSELRAPDPTLTALGPLAVILGLGELRAPLQRAHRVGGCRPETPQTINAEYARWFAVPCRTCWPDAPAPGHVWSRYVLGRVEPGVAPYLAWVPGLAWQTQVSNRGGETARADDPAGPAKGGNPAGDEPQDVEVASTYGAPSDTGKCPDNSISVSEHATTPTTPFARLRQIAEASRVAAERLGAGWYDAPDLVAALDAMVGSPDSEADAAHIVAFDPPTVLALLDVADAAREVTRRGIRSDAKGTHSRWVVRHLDAALDRLAEVTS